PAYTQALFRISPPLPAFRPRVRWQWLCLCVATAAATHALYTLSLHDALPIWRRANDGLGRTDEWPCSACRGTGRIGGRGPALVRDRKSTRLNSSHRTNSYAVLCLKKNKTSQCYFYGVKSLRCINSGWTDILGL